MGDVEYRGPERRAVEQERIIRLEAATNHLAGQVQGLSMALETVNRISARQQELEQETRIATAALASVRKGVDKLDHETVPRKEMQVRQREGWLLTGGAVLVAVHLHEVTRNVCGGERLHHPVVGAASDHSAGVEVACDVFWPEATNNAAQYPSTANVLGFLLYGVLLLWMFTQLRKAHHYRHRYRHKN